MRKLLILLAVLTLTAPLLLYGCSGNDGSTGAKGADGADGTNGTNGAPGTARITDKHGAAVAEAEELEGSLPAQVVITGATANAAGVATVTFTVKDAAGTTSITGLGAKANAASFTIASLEPAGGDFSYNRWVSYIWRPLSPTVTVNQAYRERPGANVIVEGPAGTYTYTFVQNLGTAKRPADNVAITYDRSRTHRVFVALRGSSTGYVGGDTFDFVPAGGAISQTRDIVEDATCQKCHMNTPGHYGPWDGIVKGCVICHSPGNTLANDTGYGGGAPNSLEMSVMLHKIHAGAELQSIAGPDGQYYDNPWTALDERADNGPLYILDEQGSWNTAAFPAVLANCVACHTQKVAGTLAQVDNWKTVPSRAACGSCHDLVDFATGANHSFLNLAQANDLGCAGCHSSAGITTAHDWTKKDIRNIPEFNIALTTSTPANGTYFVNGESPVISIALTDAKTGAVIVPSTVVRDAAGEGCVPLAGSEGTECTEPNDGLFTAASVYVTGPRAQRIPRLTYNARAKVTSASVGPWDLSAGGSLGLIVDSNMPLLTFNTEEAYEGYGADELISGAITVPYNNSFFPDNTAATPAQVAAWLNANERFALRAFAYVENYPATDVVGRLSIRSRGVLAINADNVVTKVTPNPNVSIVGTGPGGVAMFADNAYGVSGSAASAFQRSTTATAATDPKANFTGPTAITYTLDPVDDLVPGTYVINVEFADRGRHPTNNPSFLSHGVNEPPFTDYRTPSVAVATFQVKTATVEQPIATGCGACHWSDAGTGFVLDYPRHNKPFTDNAVEQCGGCHDYNSNQNSAWTYPYPPASGAPAGAPPSPTGGNPLSGFGGGHPISKRVHAVHNGSRLNYPTITVAHEETADFGRNWRITFPMDIRNCESCHPAPYTGTAGARTSGTWITNPNRLACMGCHDSDAATGHMQGQTYDPTPNAPFSGDERESCKTCH